ncbi:MAG: cob(I)yrinic acid a,c-diamide adenosyltransferase [Acidobacteriota bacterium]
MHQHTDNVQSEKIEHKQGLVIVITGNGKGKTTSALGQALRALGHDQKVLFLQFLKQGNFGEIEAINRFPNIEVRQFGRSDFVDPQHPQPIDYEFAGQGLRAAIDALADAGYDLVVLDEINVAVHFGLLIVDEVVDLIKRKRPEIDLVLTGRHAVPQVIELADTVSEIVDVKHHITHGIKARAGIEF